jgi:hypothetical protein
LKGIIVFVKNPKLGKVKTRLAASLGDHKALEIYNKLIGYTKDVLLQLSNVNRFVYYSSFIDQQDGWDNEKFIKRIQYQGGLGERITHALEETFENCQHIIIIGSDCPQLTPAHINEAFDRLRSNNVVIGPSQDGGYYLLGMDKFYPELFQNIEWSTATVFKETIQKTKDKNLKTSKLEVLSDIDYEEDWIKYGF